ncbi:hypothetical protein [Burkholderia pseudomallei]|jgi:hypothetical protein|uniref:hypothetical protein n=1 Tax=Burkholderia pseudomallei TaxID=28450 RepID=UPI0024DFE50E|nr:hypothetical protein [Burkholderia pseudomallei]
MSTDQSKTKFSHKGAKMMLWNSGGYIFTPSTSGGVGTVIEVEGCVSELLYSDEMKAFCAVDIPERAIQLMRMIYPLTYQRWVNKFEAQRDGTWDEEEEMYYESNT